MVSLLLQPYQTCSSGMSRGWLSSLSGTQRQQPAGPSTLPAAGTGPSGRGAGVCVWAGQRGRHTLSPDAVSETVPSDHLVTITSLPSR